MPTYQAPPYSVDLVSTAIFVDTNVWVSAFDTDDAYHLNAQYFLETTDRLLLVPISVVVETWGMLGSDRGRPISKELIHERCIAFLSWIADPGHNVKLIPELNSNINYVLDFASRYRIDCVDAMLAHLSHYVNTQCEFRPNLAIATRDERDFPTIRKAQNMNFQIYSIVAEGSY